MLNALTIDVEEHFHLCGLKTALPTQALAHGASLVEEQTERLLRLLDRKQVKATFFVLGSVAEHHPGLIRMIAQQGHEIASHGYGHTLIYQQTPEEFEADLRRALAQLTACTQEPIIGYRAPSFSMTRRSAWAIEVLARLGFRYDCSVFPIVNPRYGIPDAPRVPYRWNGLVEFPLSSLRVGFVNVPVAGGAYARLLPWSFLRQAYRRLNRDGVPVQFYVHPWELDPTIPRLPVPWHRGLTHYTNLHLMAPRMERLLDEFAFGPVREVLHLHEP